MKEKTGRWIFKLLQLKYVCLLCVFCVSIFGQKVYAAELEKAKVGSWWGAACTQEELAEYNEKFYLEASEVTSNRTHWGSSSIDKALDDDWTSHWEADAGGSISSGTYVEFAFEEAVEVGQLVYRVRQDQWTKGFPLKFKIQTSSEAAGEDFVDVAEGEAVLTLDIISIKFTPQECKRLRFVWIESYNDYPSASMFFCYKDDGIRVGTATVESWPVAYYTEEERATYNAAFYLAPKGLSTNKGHYGESSVDKAGDDDWNTHFEANVGSTSGDGTYIEVAFDDIKEVGQIIYRVRQDAWGKGFPLKFKIQASGQESGNNFWDVAEGSSPHTMDFIKITFDAVTCRRIRFVWQEAYNAYPSASVLYCYKEDNLAKELQNLFVDGAATELNGEVTEEEILRLEEKIQTHPMAESMAPYIEMAKLLLNGVDSTERIHTPITLSQKGNRGEEKDRTGLTFSLSNWDVTGYYVRPGDVLDIFVDADPNGPMPSLVLGEIARKYDSWLYGYDGRTLENGLNHIVIPEDMKGCQAIYFYNPALPQDQECAPVVRICGGNKYPVYFYDGTESPEEAKAREEAFIQEVTQYCEKVVNNMNKAALGEGEPNICEYVSDKVQLSLTAKSVVKNMDKEVIWNQGQFRQWLQENEVKYAQLQQDENGQVTGIRYRGPAAVMEAYEMMYDDMQLYCGFHVTDPAHEDYKNYGRFVFRPYTDGWGSGWAQHCFAGFNEGSADWEDPLDDGWFESLVTGDAVLKGGWAVYHEIGHLFDSMHIGVSESTNNLFGLAAQNKYLDSIRLENENRWYNHFTNYINTGILPADDTIFYPGSVVFQLDAVDFLQQSIYKETEISNYGRACRYARLHREELEGLSLQDKLIVSISMGCGVDLSSHFEFYGRKISEDARFLLSPLPKETRPTWLVNERTYKGGAFDEEDKAKTPVITSVTSANNTGAVTISIDDSIFTEENLQCFSIYRQQKTESGLIGEPEWIGVTADNKDTKNINEVYRFVDENVIPGNTYEYSIGVYDCKLIENEKKSEVKTITVAGNIEVPLKKIVINRGESLASFEEGDEFKVQAVYYPASATVDLNEIRWWAEGYADDSGKQGAGKDIITIEPDPDYPNDPTRRILRGIQYGMTTVYVQIGDVWTRQDAKVNTELKVNDTQTTRYEFEFGTERTSFKLNETYDLNLYRTAYDVTSGEEINTIRVGTTPRGTSWASSAPEIISVSDRGQITVHQEGTATISFKRGEETVAQCLLSGVSEEIPLEEVVAGVEDGLEEIDNGYQMEVGQIGKLTYELKPANATVAAKPVFKSDNTGVVRIEQDGTFTAVSGGTAKISVTVGSKVSETITVVVKEYVPLRAISLDVSEITLAGAKSTKQIKVTKIPENATISEQSVVWKSDNENVFTVNNGVVTAVGTGSATLTVSLEGKTSTVKVNVEGAAINVTGVGFRGHSIGEDISLTLKAGKTHQLVLMVEPAAATEYGEVQWTSSDESVAKVEYGYITALSKGNAIITAAISQNGTSYQAVCNVTVESSDVVLEGWGINHKLLKLGGNESVQLRAYPRPANANVDSNGNPLESVVWISEDETIATVNEHGLITTRKTGTTVITGTANGMSISCQVMVNSLNEVEEIILSEESMTIDMAHITGHKLSYTVKPEGIMDAPAWESSDPSVVEVDADGNLTVHKCGTAMITITLGEKSDSCEITVIPPQKIWISGVEDADYTGGKITQNIRVYDGDKLLKEGTDYTVSYKNNVNAYLYENDALNSFEEAKEKDPRVTAVEGFDSKKAPQVILKMKGNYKENQVVYFKIRPLNISDKEAFIAEQLSVVYNKRVQQPKPVLNWNGKTLKVKNDYTFEVTKYPENMSECKEKGTYEVTLTGKKNYTGEVTVNYTITDNVESIPMSKVKVGKIPAQDWSAEGVEPAVTVQFGSNPLGADDYEVSYRNNKAVGTGYVVLSGKGKYVGSKTISFKITGTAASKVSVTGIKADGYEYTGEPINLLEAEQAIKITKVVKKPQGNQTVEVAKDAFEVSYQKNEKAGKATMILTGKADKGYTGSKKISFKIAAKPVDKLELELNAKQANGVWQVAYMKGGTKPVVLLHDGEKELVAGRDYSVNYKNNKDVNATGVITIKGKGNYSGSRTANFVIVPKDITLEEYKTLVKVSVKDKVFSNKAGNWIQSFKVYDEDGKALDKKDANLSEAVYTISSLPDNYEGELNVGRTLNPKNQDDKKLVLPIGTKMVIQVNLVEGNYKGTVTGSYRILEAGHDISKATIEILPQTYTGKEVEITENIQFKKAVVKNGREEYKLYIKDGVDDKGNSYTANLKVTGYVKNVEKGTAKVTFKGINDFGGEKTVTFKIGQRAVTSFWDGIFESIMNLTK